MAATQKPTLPGLRADGPMGMAASNEAWASLRQKCPVAWAEDYGGFWILSKYDDIARVFRETETFSSARINDPDNISVAIQPTPVPWALIPEELDMPEFRSYRRIINSMLSPAAVRAMQPRIKRWVTHYVDQFIELGTADLAECLTTAVPGAVTLEWLGFPQEDWVRIYMCFHNLFGYPDGTEQRQAAVEELGFVHKRIDEITRDRKARPRDDAISFIVSQEIEGKLISDEYARGMVWLAIGGGVDTTASLTGATLVHLHHDHELRRRLIAEPELRRTATEEFLRMHAPVRGHARTVVAETEIRGVVMRPGDRVLVGEYSACHDEDEFEDPTTFVVDRSPNRHAAFGLGIHRCPGSHLARAEFDEMLSQVLERIPDYVILETEAREYPIALSSLGGWAELPVTFTPGVRVGVE